MIGAIKSEFHKLLSVRTTYVLTGLGLLLTIFVTGYIQGFKLDAVGLQNSEHYNDVITGSLTSIPLILGSIVAVLLIVHEYRYNTILYTLTTNSRMKVLLSKIVAISAYAVVLTVLVAIIGPLASHIGIQLKGSHLVHQHLEYGSLIWRSLFYGWTSLLSALLIGVLIRSQVGAIVTLFVVPTIELMVSGLLKAHAVYLPFTGASNAILVPSDPSRGVLSFGHAALLFGGYLLFGWIVAWILFLKRDSN
jgi:ABC-type transport system involved in multi-copper enzyme maturation permease subunit